MSRYLVTGCAGFIGSTLVEALLARGDEVVGIDAFTDHYDRDQKEANLAAARQASGFSLVEADLAEAELEPLLDGVEGIFHLAGEPGIRPSWGQAFGAYVRNNVLATQRLADAAAAAGLRLVYTSSSSIYGDAERYPTPEGVTPAPISPYGVTKLAAEHLVQAFRVSAGLDAVVLRLFTVYGPRQRPDMAFSRLLGALLDGRPFTVFGTLELSRDFTFVGDVVSAALLALARAPGGATYNVGGGQEASLGEVVAAAERLGARRLELVHDERARGDARRTAADTTRIREELGWEPRTSLEQGLAAQLEWLKRPVPRRG